MGALPLKLEIIEDMRETIERCPTIQGCEYDKPLSIASKPRLPWTCIYDFDDEYAPGSVDHLDTSMLVWTETAFRYANLPRQGCRWTGHLLLLEITRALHADPKRGFADGNQPRALWTRINRSSVNPDPGAAQIGRLVAIFEVKFQVHRLDPAMP